MEVYNVRRLQSWAWFLSVLLEAAAVLACTSAHLYTVSNMHAVDQTIEQFPIEAMNWQKKTEFFSR